MNIFFRLLRALGLNSYLRLNPLSNTMKRNFTLSILSICMGAGLAFGQSKQAVNATRMQHNPVQSGIQLYNSAPPVVQVVSGYYQQNFESTTFPPTGWSSQNDLGTNVWSRSTAQAHGGLASAYISYQSTGGLDWLITPQFQVNAATDSVTFWMRLAYAGYAPDSLAIKVSTTSSVTTNFTSTLLLLREGVNYPANSSTWYRYSIPLTAYVGQNVFIAFKHYDNDGDGLYIDDVALGTKPANDIMAVSVDMPGSVAGSVTPKATFSNVGSAAQSFSVTTSIAPGGYSSTQMISSLAPNASAQATFSTWVPAAGTYTVKSYSQSAGDANPSSDTVSKVVQVFSAFPNMGWTSKAPASAVWATGPVFAKPCVSGTDTGYIYNISGGDASFANSTLNQAYNITLGTWQTKAPIPASRTQMTPVRVKNRIYAIGGYGGSFTPVTTNSIYDMAANTWTTGAALPTAVGDYGVGVYKDSLIYIIGGYNGSSDVNTVQVYNPSTNTWTAGTSKSGTAVAGGRASITGNTIVFAGGYSQTLATEIADVVVGTINPAGPAGITWASGPAYPGGTVGRLACGVLAENDGRVYFAGGDPDGNGTSVMNTVFAYNTASSMWESGPNMITGMSNISALAGVVQKDTLYLVTIGGYNGTAVTAVNEWLKIGALQQMPSVQSGTAICYGGSTVLNAYNGTSYAWSGSNLGSTNTSSTTATPSVTATYTVSIGRPYGCPLNAMVTVTVNSLPSVSASGNPTAICNGQSAALSASGAATYTWSTTENTSAISVNPSGNATYTVTGTDANGCSNMAMVTVTVNAVPAVTASSSSTTICNGQSAVLTAGGATTYTWSTTENTSTINVSPATTTTYVVTGETAGCANTATVVQTVAVCTGISNAGNIAGAVVYPNPSAGLFNISLGTVSEHMLIEVYNMTGQVVYRKPVKEAIDTIDLSDLSKGIYTIRLSGNGSMLYTTRVVKN